MRHVIGDWHGKMTMANGRLSLHKQVGVKLQSLSDVELPLVGRSWYAGGGR